jgi:hypothetical protein
MPEAAKCILLISGLKSFQFRVSANLRNMLTEAVTVS